MSNPTYIVDIIGEVVRTFTPDILPVIKTNEIGANTSSLIDTIDYQYGHTVELIQTLAQYDKVDSFRRLKYPLVWLVMDFPEKRGKLDWYATTTLNIIIAHQTESTDKMENRMIKVFKPVLYPIYYALLDGLASHDLINENDADILQHTKYDRGYMGNIRADGNIANKLNDYVDAIEIINLNLTILKNNC